MRREFAELFPKSKQHRARQPSPMARLWLSEDIRCHDGDRDHDDDEDLRIMIMMTMIFFVVMMASMIMMTMRITNSPASGRLGKR